MTPLILVSVALGVSLVLNAMQASKAQEWRNKVKELTYQIDLLTRPIEDDEAVHTFNPDDRADFQKYIADENEAMDDWLERHKGVTPKPGYERKRR